MSPHVDQPGQMLPLSPQVFHILLALSNGERHGYAIMQEVAERSGGEIRIGPGTLYGAIRRLLERGAVVESEERPAPEHDDERRRYYGLTRFGRDVLAAEARRLERLVTVLRAADLFPGTRPS
jgi:DNA-binding PadR family transcriptional regulator